MNEWVTFISSFLYLFSSALFPLLKEKTLTLAFATAVEGNRKLTTHTFKGKKVQKASSTRFVIPELNWLNLVSIGAACLMLIATIIQLMMSGESGGCLLLLLPHLQKQNQNLANTDCCYCLHTYCWECSCQRVYTIRGTALILGSKESCSSKYKQASTHTVSTKSVSVCNYILPIMADLIMSESRVQWNWTTRKRSLLAELTVLAW